ncbi:Rpn family recombination-promoting nuclease/putative transposase [bacterium]|nr:Rpn family recombination-promoting nuclease/putative transposase [bacterium]
MTAMDQEFRDNPHDKVFRETFSSPEAAAMLFRRVLPPIIADGCDWDSLELIPNAWVSQDFKDRRGDLLYRIQHRSVEVHIRLLFEHQSSPDPRMPLRILDYMVRIWEEAIRENGNAPPVVPIVLYQGVAPWNAPDSISGMLHLSPEGQAAFGPYLPDFRLEIVELRHFTLEELRALEEVGIILGLMQAVMQEPATFLKTLEGLASRMHEIGSARGVGRLLDLALRYLYFTETKVPRSRIKQAIVTGSDRQIGEKYMTHAEELILEGRVKGRAEGRAEGRVEGEALSLRRNVMRVLLLKHGVGAEAFRERVEAVSEVETLEHFLEAAVLSSSLDDFARVI